MQNACLGTTPGHDESMEYREAYSPNRRNTNFAGP